MHYLITLTTDFGSSDSYVAQMKGIITSLLPAVSLVDISHHIAPQNIRHGSQILAEACFLFPPSSSTQRTVHLAVVDPGVGTQRRLVAAEIQGHFFVLPDNGLLTNVLAQASESQRADVTVQHQCTQAVEIDANSYCKSLPPHLVRNPIFGSPSHTFHGRDLMAPAAAMLARDGDIQAIGRSLHNPMRNLVRLPAPKLEETQEKLTVEVIHIDHYGNIITSASWQAFSNWAEDPRKTRGFAVAHTKKSGSQIARCLPSYGHAEIAELLILEDSQGRLEIGCRDRSAADRLAVQPADLIEITRS